MNPQERHFCKECKREWMIPRANYANSAPCSITGNPLTGDNCPYCGSPELSIIIFKASYPGLDIPRDNDNNPIPHQMAPPESIEKIGRDHYIRPNPLLFEIDGKIAEVVAASEPNPIMILESIPEDMPQPLETPEVSMPIGYHSIFYGE